MRTWNHLFLVCLAGTILLGAGVVFVPRHFSRKLDMRQANQITMVSRDDFSFLEQGEGTVMDHVRVLRNLRPDSEGLTLITSVDDSERVNDEILKNVYEQTLVAAGDGMLPWLWYLEYGEYMESYENWIGCIKFAKYYSLAYDSERNPNTRELLNFWLFRFSDENTFDYYFLVDAITFRIYYAEIYNRFTHLASDYWETILSQTYRIQNGSTNAVSIYDWGTSDSKTKKTVDSEYFYEEFNYLYDQFGYGCLDYYEADDMKLANIFPATDQGSSRLRMSLVILNYGSEAAYIEQKIVEKPLFDGYRGISIGLQGIDTSVRALLEE